ncbi:phosphonate ABC transporter ATP-binding protein, partial [Pseudomonas aeruginosa]
QAIASLVPESARKVMDILADIYRHDGKTVEVTLHQVDFALRYCPRAVALKGGPILFDGSSEHLYEGFVNELYGAEGDTPLL